MYQEGDKVINSNGVACVIDRIERMAVVAGCNPRGDGEYRSLLEAGDEHIGAWRL